MVSSKPLYYTYIYIYIYIDFFLYFNFPALNSSTDTIFSSFLQGPVKGPFPNEKYSKIIKNSHNVHSSLFFDSWIKISQKVPKVPFPKHLGNSWLNEQDIN